MIPYSLLDRRAEESIVNALYEQNISILARGTVAQGLLAGKPPKEYLQHPVADVSKAAAAIRTISNEKRTDAQTAIQFVLSRPFITSAVVGIRHLEQLKVAAGAANGPFLSESELDFLTRSIAPKKYTDHR